MTTNSKPLDLEQFEGHTPGPWQMLEDGRTSVTLIHVENADNGSPVCSIPRKRVADANLCAAAPALLALAKEQRAQISALQADKDKLREALRSVERQLSSNARSGDWDSIDQARAALAATGPMA